MTILIKRTFSDHGDLSMDIKTGENSAHCSFKGGALDAIELFDKENLSAGVFHFQDGKVLGNVSGKGTVDWSGDQACHTQVNGTQFLNLFFGSSGKPFIYIADENSGVHGASIGFSKDLKSPEIEEHYGRDVFIKNVNLNDSRRVELSSALQKSISEKLSKLEALEGNLPHDIVETALKEAKGSLSIDDQVEALRAYENANQIIKNSYGDAQKQQSLRDKLKKNQINTRQSAAGREK